MRATCARLTKENCERNELWWLGSNSNIWLCNHASRLTLPRHRVPARVSPRYPSFFSRDYLLSHFNFGRRETLIRVTRLIINHNRREYKFLFKLKICREKY